MGGTHLNVIRPHTTNPRLTSCSMGTSEKRLPRGQEPEEEVPAAAVRPGREMKGIRAGQEEVTPSLLADDVILCPGDPKDSTRNCGTDQ